MVVFSQNLVEELRAQGYILGHAGHGNLRVTLVWDPSNKSEWAALEDIKEDINNRIVPRAVQLEGTCTGEHGIGIGKRKFMSLEHDLSYDLMKRIKKAVDPKGLMNPDKIF